MVHSVRSIKSVPHLLYCIYYCTGFVQLYITLDYDSVLQDLPRAINLQIYNNCHRHTLYLVIDFIFLFGDLYTLICKLYT